MSNSANVSTVRLNDGREVCFSYGVAVAAFIPGRGYVKTGRKYSVTTTTYKIRIYDTVTHDVTESAFDSPTMRAVYAVGLPIRYRVVAEWMEAAPQEASAA